MMMMTVIMTMMIIMIEYDCKDCDGDKDDD